MNKARLIKRREVLERAAKKTAQLSFAAQVKGETVLDWVKSYQAYRQPNARALFAALFTHPQTN